MLRFALFAVMVLYAPVSAAQEQHPAHKIATIDQERLFAESRAGRETIIVFQLEKREISAQAKALQIELEAEEQALAQRRSELDPQEFAKLAQEFDEKITKLRDEQVARNREINQNFERARLDFFTAIEPVLQQMFVELGVSLVVNPSAIRYTAEDIDLTQQAIARINQTIKTQVEKGPTDE